MSAHDFEQQPSVLEDNQTIRFAVGGVAFTFTTYMFDGRVYTFMNNETVMCKVRSGSLTKEQKKFLRSDFGPNGYKGNNSSEYRW